MYINILPFTPMTKQEIQKRLTEIENDIPNYSYDSDEYRILSYQLEWFRQQLKKLSVLKKLL